MRHPAIWLPERRLYYRNGSGRGAVCRPKAAAIVPPAFITNLFDAGYSVVSLQDQAGTPATYSGLGKDAPAPGTGNWLVNSITSVNSAAQVVQIEALRNTFLRNQFGALPALAGFDDNSVRPGVSNPSLTQPYTLFFAGRRTADTSNEYLFSGDSTTTDYLLKLQTTNVLRVRTGTGTNAEGGTLAATANYVVVATVDATDGVKGYMNDMTTPSATSASSSSGYSTQIIMGSRSDGADGWNGSIVSWGYMSGLASEAQRLAFKSWVNTIYGFGVA